MIATEIFDFAEARRATYTPPEHHDGKTCPFCGSDQIDSPYPDDYDGETVKSPWECCDCLGQWNMVYTLTRFEHTDIHGKVLTEFPHTVEFRRDRAYRALLVAAEDARRVLECWHPECEIDEALAGLHQALAYGEDFGQDLPL